MFAMSQHLRSFPGFETSDPEVNRDVLRANFAVSHYDCINRDGQFLAKANWVETKYVRITNAFCSTSTNIIYEATPHVKLLLNSGAAASTSISVDRHRRKLLPLSGAVIVPAHMKYEWVAHEAHAAFALKIEESALKKVASAMLGDDLKGELDFRSYLPKSDAAFRQLQGSVMQLIRDLDTAVPSTSIVADALSQALLVRFLLASSHRFSDQLEKESLSPSTAQLRQVEDFIANNWRRELDIDEIARTFGIGTRSIFRYFKTIRGITPTEFMRQIRLSNAHRMLETASEDDSVMAIAAQCGFHSMGHFAREYRRAFDELPSETLRIARFSRSAISNLSYRPLA